ncbi:MAG TPA: hypothetical protein VJ810_34755 [Blastocatellia bacterium]|nr:hypothetical protein [Blastocatellia bacterium]
MYTRTDISLDDRLEIFSRYWRFGDDYGTVSHLAEEFRTSRQFIYDLSTRVKQALDWRPAGRPEEDRRQDEIARLKQRVRELEADCDGLEGQLALERAKPRQDRFRLLMELALSPVSEEKIVRCLEAAFGPEGQVSVGWVNSQLQKAGQAALSILQGTKIRESVREAAIDELFRHRQPILCVIDPQTLLATVPEAAENRKGETWQAVLDQYPNLEFVVSDQASGLRKGVNDSRRRIAHQYDVFHFKREIGRWMRSQEARCYELMEQLEQARRLIDAPRLLSSARIQARVEYRQKAAALDERLLTFDWVELIVNYLYESLTAYDVRRGEIRTKAGAEAMIEEVVGLLKEVELINTRPLITMIEGARPGLLTFLTVLEKKLQQIEVRWRYVTGSRPAAFNALARAWYHRPGAHQSRRGQYAYLRALCGLGHWSRRIENFAEVQRQVYEVLDQVVRASSAVECFNSLLRPYVAVKKHLSQGFLALIALYHNTRPLSQRGNRSPLELAGVDLGDDDWVRLLEHEMRYGKLATQDA